MGGKKKRNSPGKDASDQFKGLTRAELLDELTRLKRANTRLKNSNARLKSRERELDNLFALSMDMVCIASMTHFLKVNPAFERVLGYTEEELLSIPFIDLIHPDDAVPTAKYIEEKLKKGEPAINFRNRYRAKDGSYKCFEWMTRPVPEKGLLYGVARDVTLQVDVEDELMLQGEVIRNVAEGVMLARLEDGNILYANPTFERMFGYGPGELEGRHVSVLNALDGKDSVDAAKEIAAALESDGGWSGELRNIRADGSAFWSYAKISGFRHHEYGEVWISVQRDITKRRELEEERERTLKLLEAVMCNTEDVIFVKDKKGRYLLVNRMFCEVLGIPEDEVLGRTVEDIFPEEIGRKLREDDERVLTSGMTESIEEEVITRAGEKKYYLSTKSVLKDSEGNPVGTMGAAHDITARREMERVLIESEQAYRSMFEGSPMPMIIFDPGTFDILAVNDAAVAHYGWGREEFLSLTVKDIRPEDEVPKLIETIRKAPEGLDKAGIFLHMKKDGTLIRVEITSHPIGFNGRTARLVMVNDVTERLKAEEALIESEEKFRAIFERAPDAILLADTETGIILDANPVASKLMGRPAAEIIGLHQSEIHPPEDEQYSRDGFREHAEQGDGSRPIENRIVRADGTVVPVEIMGHTFTYQGRNVLMGIFRDITERKLAEEVIRESEERLKSAQRVARLGFWDWNILTGDLYWSDEIYLMLGYEPQEFKPSYEKFMSLVHPDDIEHVQRSVDAALKDDIRYEIDFRYIPDSGDIIYVNGQGEVARDAHGTPVRFVGTMLDITERKLIEEKLRRSLSEKEVLLQEVHHRVKNNLNVVISLMGLQERTLSDPETKQRFKDAQARVMAIARLHELIYRSEDFTRIDAKEYIEGISMELLTSYSGDGRDLELRVHVDDIELSINELIPCGLVVNELVTNSLKHAFKDVKDGRLEVSLKREGGEAVLSVSDNGRGIPDDLDPKMASSLGLVIVNALARQLGGRFELYTEKGTRAEVRFSLPGRAYAA